jgi:hypothetical protein
MKADKDGNSYIKAVATQADAENPKVYIKAVATQADTENPKVSRDANGNVMVTVHDFNLSTEDFCETPKRESRETEYAPYMFFLPCWTVPQRSWRMKQKSSTRRLPKFLTKCS